MGTEHYGAACLAPHRAVWRERRWEPSRKAQQQLKMLPSDGCLPCSLLAAENHLSEKTGGAEMSCSSFLPYACKAYKCISLIHFPFGTTAALM